MVFNILGKFPGTIFALLLSDRIGRRRTVSLLVGQVLVCLYWQVQVRGHNFSHKLLGCKCLLQSLYLLTPCLTWDSAVHVLTHCCNGAPVIWEMSLGDEHRNRTLPLQLGHFSWPSFITTDGSSDTSKSSEPALLLIFVKPPFVPNFISQLVGQMHFHKLPSPSNFFFVFRVYCTLFLPLVCSSIV